MITPTAKIAAPTHGGRAKCLQRLVRLDLPVPKTVALSFDAIKGIVSGKLPDLIDILSYFDKKDTLCVRPSSESIDWGGPGAVLNIGMNDDRCLHLSKSIGDLFYFVWHKRTKSNYLTSIRFNCLSLFTCPKR